MSDAPDALYAELEALVIREMQTSVEREQAMQLVLDSMHDGLLVCELDGSASPIRSRSMTQLFGEPGATKVWDYLSDGHAELALHFEIGWDQVVRDVLPFDIAVSQLPADLHRGDRTYRLAYQRVERDGELARLAVSLRDVTDELAAQRAHELAAELGSVVKSLLADPAGFASFLDETDALIDQLAGDPLRGLHTLKGNTAMLGFRWFAARCHALEDELATGVALDDERLERLRRGWEQAVEQIRPLLGAGPRDEVTISRRELADTLDQLRDAGVPRDLLAGLAAWQLEPVAPWLERCARQARRIAEAQGKHVAVTVEHGRIRFPAAQLNPVLTNLVHAVRNAVDHGLEPPAERRAAGKAETGQLVLSCRLADELVLEIRDDGRGIDWDRVRAKARALGLPDADAREALFADGVSTASEISEISGRGVGLGALRDACRALGGSLVIESTTGRGTRVICRIPRSRG